MRQLCSKSALLATYGDAKIILSEAHTFSYEKQTATLREYILNMMEPQELDKGGHQSFYHFGDHRAAFEPLLAEYILPSEWDQTQEASLSWGLAGDLTGVPFHVHGHVFAEVLVGRKVCCTDQDSFVSHEITEMVYIST